MTVTKIVGKEKKKKKKAVREDAKKQSKCTNCLQIVHFCKKQELALKSILHEKLGFTNFKIVFSHHVYLEKYAMDQHILKII